MKKLFLSCLLITAWIKAETPDYLTTLLDEQTPETATLVKTPPMPYKTVEAIKAIPAYAKLASFFIYRQYLQPLYYKIVHLLLFKKKAPSL